MNTCMYPLTCHDSQALTTLRHSLNNCLNVCYMLILVTLPATQGLAYVACALLHLYRYHGCKMLLLCVNIVVNDILCINVAAAMCKYHHHSANVLILFVMAADTVNVTAIVCMLLPMFSNVIAKLMLSLLVSVIVAMSA